MFHSVPHEGRTASGCWSVFCSRVDMSVAQHIVMNGSHANQAFSDMSDAVQPVTLTDRLTISLLCIHQRDLRSCTLQVTQNLLDLGQGSCSATITAHPANGTATEAEAEETVPLDILVAVGIG